MSFEEEIKIENKTRNQEWFLESRKREFNGENIYTDFCLHCNCNNKERTEENFNDWLNKETIEINFWQLKHIKEKYFDYKYNFIENKKWEIKKNGKIYGKR